MSDKKKWYAQNSKVGDAFNAFYKSCEEDTVLDKKTVELMKLALACVFRCPHCTDQHVKKALDAGASKQEVTEALLIAAVEGAGTQLAWRKETFKKYLSE
ncbi:MAG: carboxymuconolactone decarboxylase family protein [Candidatus Omnitrophota bacterium]